MIIYGSDGTENKINSKDYVVNIRKCSSLHLEARKLLKELFGTRTILEEVFIKSDKLYFDFFIPSCNLILETDGEQHQKFNSFFYEDKLSFAKAKMRDKKKQDICDINGFTLIRLPHNENLEEWRGRIIRAFDIERED